MHNHDYAIGLEKIQDGFDDDGSFMQNVLKTKLCIDGHRERPSKLWGVLAVIQEM